MAHRLLRRVDKRFLRFLTVGLASVVVDTAALFVLHGLLQIWLPLATSLAYATAFVVNFGLNRTWVFRSSGAVGRQLGGYLTLVMINLLLTVIAVQSLTWLGVQYLVAKVVTAAVLAVLNFVVSRRWIFVATT